MKKKLFCLLILAITSVCAQEWEVQETNIKSNLRSVCFLDSLNGWVTTDSTIFLHSTDGGKKWSIEKINGEDYSVKQIQFVTKDIGYACGSLGRLFSTKDGGKTWIVYSNIFAINFLDIFFVDENEGWSVGEYYGSNYGRGMIVHTSDGGINWSKQLEIESTNQLAVKFFKSIKMKNINDGWALAGDYFDNLSPTYVYKTTDGGKNWDVLSSPIQRPARKLKVACDDTLWVDGYGIAPMSITTDACTSWNFISSEYMYVLAISPQSGNVGWICNRDFSHNLPSIILYTSNGGISWTNELSIYDHNIIDIENKGNYVWIVGDGGLIMRKRITITSIDEQVDDKPSFLKSFQNYPNPFNSQTIISYHLLESSNVEIEIFNALGEIIRKYNLHNQHIGKNELIWDAKDNLGNLVSSGIYIYLIKAIMNNGKAHHQLAKMMLLK